MLYTLISFENLQNINVCLGPGKMNGYAETPGHTSLLKMCKIVVDPIGPEPTLLPHSPVAPTCPFALSSTQRWWNDTKAVKIILRGSIEAAGSTDSRYLELFSATCTNR